MKPLVTIILFTYNQENLVTEAVESLFAQTYSPLQIILSDDVSSDNTYAVMQNLAQKYQGIHQVKLNRNVVNQGLAVHINTAIALAEGELIFAAAGDDVSLPNRCEKVVAAWLAGNKQADLIATDVFDMSFSGEILGVKNTDNLENWRNIQDWFKHQPYIFGASHTWSSNLINRFGALNTTIKQEDQVMTFRAIFTGSALRLAIPLVKHRRGGVSQQAKLIDVNVKRSEMLAGYLNSLEFMQQCIQDAKLVGQEGVVEAKFAGQLKLAQMAKEMFQADSTLDVLTIAFSTSQVSTSKKIRLVIYAAFPWILKPLFWFKKVNFE